MERIQNLVKYEEMMNEFDHAYIFISSMSSRQKRDMCACFLKLGYGIREESPISMHVVNLSDDNKFFANISFLVWFFDIMSYISICKEEKCREFENREEERTHVKKEFKLKTYKDYSRLSRQTISARSIIQRKPFFGLTVITRYVLSSITDLMKAVYSVFSKSLSSRSL